MNKQWIVYSPYTDIDTFDDYEKALAEYESVKEYLMSEGHEIGTQVHLLETIKVATSKIDEEKMKINTPQDEGFEWENWAKWDELNATIEWEHSYEKESMQRGLLIEQLQQEIKEWERIRDKQVEHLVRNGKELIKLTEQLEQTQQEIGKYKEIIQRYTFEAAFNEEDDDDDDI